MCIPSFVFSVALCSSISGHGKSETQTFSPQAKVFAHFEVLASITIGPRHLISVCLFLLSLHAIQSRWRNLLFKLVIARAKEICCSGNFINCLDLPIPSPRLDILRNERWADLTACQIIVATKRACGLDAMYANIIHIAKANNGFFWVKSLSNSPKRYWSLWDEYSRT